MLKSETALYKRKGSKINIETIDDAKNARSILIPRIFYSYQELIDLGFKNLDAVADSETAVRMLVKGRSDLLALDKAQINPILQKLGSPESAAVFVLDIKPAISYLAFSKAIPDEVIKAWQHALNNMKKDGAYDRIYNSWF